MITTLLASLANSKKRYAYYLSASAFTTHPGHANLKDSFSRCVPPEEHKLFFSSSHTRREKVPVYYLNNGSRARVIVSPLFLFRRLTLLVAEK